MRLEIMKIMYKCWVWGKYHCVQMLNSDTRQIMRKSDESENVAVVVEWEKGFLTQDATYRGLRQAEKKAQTPLRNLADHKAPINTTFVTIFHHIHYRIPCHIYIVGFSVV